MVHSLAKISKISSRAGDPYKFDVSFEDEKESVDFDKAIFASRVFIT